MIDAGELTKRVAYQEKTQDDDSFGQSLKLDWVTRWRAWARVRELAGRELEIARQLVAEATHEIKLRGPRVIATTARFEWRDRAGNVHHGEVATSAKDVQENQAELTLIVIERPKQK